MTTPEALAVSDVRAAPETLEVPAHADPHGPGPGTAPASVARPGRWIDHWEPEDETFWETVGKPVARKNLILSMFAEHIGFCIWVLWTIVVLNLGGLVNAQNKDLSKCTNDATQLERCGTAPRLVGIQQWLNTPQGKPVSLAQYKGKVVLMDFWATWCGPCVEEMPNVIAAYNKFKGKGFDVLGISLDEADGRAKLVSFTKENKMPWRQIYDGKGGESAIGTKYGVQAIPFSLLLDRNGTIAAVNPRGELLEPAIRAALAKK